MNIARINELLVDSLGEVDRLTGLPDSGTEVVNLFAVPITLRTDKVREHEDEMVELLREWPSECWGRQVPPLGSDLDYLTVGGVLGDQRRALMLFAFGKLLGWWSILDPHTIMGMDTDDSMGHQLVAMGMLLISGYNPRVSQP